jgi:hypothetical protein
MGERGGRINFTANLFRARKFFSCFTGLADYELFSFGAPEKDLFNKARLTANYELSFEQLELFLYM